MKKVITLTLNPAIDVHVSCREFIEGSETIGEITSKEAGGKGINISKALKENDIESTAVLIVGNKNKDEFISDLDLHNINHMEIVVDGLIRENITIHPEIGKETRLSFNGFKVNSSVINDIKEAVGNVDENTILTITGSNPEGLNKDDICFLINEYRNLGLKIVIDSRSFMLDDMIKLKPWLIKPNEPEIKSYFNLDDNASLDDYIDSGITLFEKGIQNVMITLGKKGALLINKDGIFKASVKDVKVKSTIGAGDSTIAGYIKGYLLGFDTLESFKLSQAFGSAKVLNGGTIPPKKEDVLNLLNDTHIEKLR